MILGVTACDGSFITGAQNNLLIRGNSKLVIFEKSGYSVPADEHDKYIKMLRDFIEEDAEHNSGVG